MWNVSDILTEAATKMPPGRPVEVGVGGPLDEVGRQWVATVYAGGTSARMVVCFG
jgi:hypothetical protein